MRPRLKLGGPLRNPRREKSEPVDKPEQSGRKESWERGMRRFLLGQRLLRVLGDAPVYLKVSVLVEAGEAIRHFASLTPLRTTLSG